MDPLQRLLANIHRDYVNPDKRAALKGLQPYLDRLCESATFYATPERGAWTEKRVAMVDADALLTIMNISALLEVEDQG